MSTSNAKRQSTKGAEQVSNNPQQESKQQPGTELVVAPVISGLEVGGLARVTDEVAEAFGQAIEGPRNEAPGINIINIDHKNEQFLVNGEPRDTVRGYIVHWFQARAWWKKAYQAGDNSPPDCASADMLKPIPGLDDQQADACHECPLAQFGSGRDDKSQACKVTTFLFLLDPEYGNPPMAALLVPPSSIRNVVGTARSPGYLGRAKHVKNPKTGKSAGFFELVYTEFRLERGGDLHCVLVPEPLTVAPTAVEARAIAGVRGRLLKTMEELRGRVGQLGERHDG